MLPIRYESGVPHNLTKLRKMDAGCSARQPRPRRPSKPSVVLEDSLVKANVLITDSHDAIEKWVLMPEADRAGAGRIRRVTPGKKYYLPFVVTDYPWQASERMTLTAHVRFISPAGKILFESPTFSRTIAPDPRSPSVIVLNPVMDVTFDPDDLPGTYTIRVTVTDHVHSAYAKADEQFQLIQGTREEAVNTPATASRTEPR